MTKYKISNLNSNTPKSDQINLEKKLKAVKGIDEVHLHPERSEISIKCAAKTEPPSDLLMSAVKTAGFTLGDKC